MYFDEKTDKYFARWICNSTWNSYHPLDIERFHVFVKALYHYKSGSLPGTDVIEQVISDAIRKNHPGYNQQTGDRQANEFAERAQVLIDFLHDTRNTEIPNQAIENHQIKIL
jgi:hypothetical protein